VNRDRQPPRGAGPRDPAAPRPPSPGADAVPARQPGAELYTLHRLTVTLPGAALFAALAASVPGLSRHQARLAIAGGLARVDGKPAPQPMATLGERAEIELDLRHGIRKAVLARKHQEPAPMERPFTILYEDDQLVVVDKAAGVVSAPMERGERGHVPELLRRTWRKRGRDVRFLGVVHRLDKETSGCLCFALTREAHRLLGAQFASHAAGRVYRALVTGVPRQERDTIRGRIAHGLYGRRVLLRDDGTAPGEAPAEERGGRPGDRRRPRPGRPGPGRADHAARERPQRAALDADDHDGDDEDADLDGEDAEDGVDRDGGRGKPAVTHFHVLRRFARAAELEVELETGRTHQIRVSLAAIGCPVLGDRVYGFRGDDRRLRPGEAPLPPPPRLLLHAERLALDHPMTGKRMTFEAPLPPAFTDFAQVLAADQTQPRPQRPPRQRPPKPPRR
jgi:23S rRNA pseudouridine1911/1915/1917 synthase